MAKILPPRDLLDRMNRIASDCPEVRVRRVGHSEGGRAIDMYSLGEGSSNTLWYGFPDPGEAVGGSVILDLLTELVRGEHRDLRDEFTWHFIPCINPDDQPDNGTQLSAVMKTPDQEIDWLAMRPRAETRILLELADELSPAFTFPLHDEYHCGESLPVYWPTSRILPEGLCRQARSDVLAAGLEVSHEFTHELMGLGFFVMSDHEGFEQSTFSRFAEHGLVAIMEVPYAQDARTLIRLQKTYGLQCLSALCD